MTSASLRPVMPRRTPPSRLPHSRWAGAILLAAVVAAPLGAQSSALVDEATFMVTRNGTPIGRESFRLVRTPAPGGQVYRATGQSSLGDSRVSSTLGTDSTGVPVSYESEVTQAGQLVQRLQGRGRPGRFTVISQTTSGESAREFLLNNGALIIDENVFHHYVFATVLQPQTHVVVITPRTAGQERLQLEDRGAADVQLAGRTLPARHLVLAASSGNARHVWVDAQGRLLKVAVPERGLVALRDDPPR